MRPIPAGPQSFTQDPENGKQNSKRESDDGFSPAGVARAGATGDGGDGGGQLGGGVAQIGLGDLALEAAYERLDDVGHVARPVDLHKRRSSCSAPPFPLTRLKHAAGQEGITDISA